MFLNTPRRLLLGVSVNFLGLQARQGSWAVTLCFAASGQACTPLLGIAGTMAHIGVGHCQALAGPPVLCPLPLISHPRLCPLVAPVQLGRAVGMPALLACTRAQPPGVPWCRSEPFVTQQPRHWAELLAVCCVVFMLGGAPTLFSGAFCVYLSSARLQD